MAPARCGTLRRAGTSVWRLPVAVAVIGPLEAAAAILLLCRPGLVTHLLHAGPMTGWMYEQDAAEISAASDFGLILVGLLLVTTIPRLLAAVLQPGKTYPLYGVHFALQRLIAGLTNVKFFTHMFGDSSAVVHYLRALGYRLAPIEQTGSNFGIEVKHEMPTLSAVGTGTMVSDGLSFVNAEFSATSFRVLPATVGTRNFVGNNVVYPAGARTGDNCLFATKAMIPIAGPVREGVGLLGSPCFEIPRTVARDHRFDHLTTGPGRQRQLAAKNRHNAGTVGLYLLVRWIYLFGLFLCALLTAGGDGRSGVPEMLVIVLCDLAFTVGYFVLVERAVTRFRGLRPQYCSVYSYRSGGTSATGRCPPPPTSSCSTAPPSRASSGACSASGSAAGSSTMAATSLNAPWPAWAATAPSTREARYKAIPWKTGPSNQTTSASGPAAPSAPMPSCTTA